LQLKKKKFERKISLTKDARDGILSFCKMNHPNEGILILRGKSKRGDVFIDELVVPPFSETGADFAGFPNNPLPLDLSYVGIVHSHPSGSAKPSLTDLDNFFGLVSMIVQSPYEDDDIFVWDSDGRELPLVIV
jgi:proteasome lid subunit RPN8/RPN11